MKRTILGILMLALLLTACQPMPSARAEGALEAAGAAPAPREEDAAKIRMLNDLVGYIYQCETMYGDIQWVLESFDRFDGQRSWENLQLARATLAIARSDLSRCALPELEMTPEDQMELMQRGIDVSFMENVESTFEGEKTFLTNACVNLHNGIMLGVFLQGDWEVCMQHVALLKELLTCDIQYLADTADWVLATLNDDETTESFYGVMDSYCPKTRACQAEDLERPEDIEAVADSLLDHVESLLLEEAKVVGAQSDRLNLMTEWIEREDFASIGEDILEISNMPLVIFYPTWYEDADVYYFWEENGEILDAPAPGTALEKAPNGCQIRIAGVTKGEVTDYQEELERAGLPSLGSTEEDGSLRVLYAYQDSVFALIWEEDSAVILMTGQPVCFVPRWYLPAKDAVK